MTIIDDLVLGHKLNNYSSFATAPQHRLYTIASVRILPIRKNAVKISKWTCKTKISIILSKNKFTP
jgi:hypothetical protein